LVKKDLISCVFSFTHFLLPLIVGCSIGVLFVPSIGVAEQGIPKLFQGVVSRGPLGLWEVVDDVVCIRMLLLGGNWEG